MPPLPGVRLGAAMLTRNAGVGKVFPLSPGPWHISQATIASARWRPRATAADPESGATDFRVASEAEEALLRPSRKSPTATTISTPTNTPTPMPSHFRIFIGADDGPALAGCKGRSRLGSPPL